MPRKLEHALSARRVQTAGPGRHCDGGGLYLQVTTTKDGKGTSRSWIFRYRVNGKLRDMGLGSLSTIGLSEARERSRALRMKRLDGIDPIDERRTKQGNTDQLLTFDEAATKYFAERGLRRDQQRFTTYASPLIGKVPLHNIDTTHITKVLDPVWSKTPEVAARLRTRIEAILDWAKVRGHRKGENPARWKGHLDHVYESVAKAKKAKRERLGLDQHRAALPYVELPTLLIALRIKTGSAARALEFTILTAARTNEVIKATWSEIDIDAKLWTVPANRMKAGKEHRVPLCDRAIAILKEMAKVRRGDFVFPNYAGDGSLSSMTLWTLLRTLHKVATVHGFRSTFRDWAAEQTNVAREVAEQSLAHSLPDATEAAYRRSDMLNKRRLLMQAWDKFCTTPPQDGAVVPIRRKS